MNKNSNKYIIGYSVVLVVVVASLLSITSLSLQSRQDANVVVEKKSDILMSIGEGSDADKAKDKTAYIDEQYAKYIVDSYAVNVAGDKVADADAFNLLRNLKAEYDKPEADRLLPVFVSKSDNGEIKYIIPLWGKGLWGPVWGYVALAENWDTISGVVFDHKSETPGLGAEITTPAFEDQFKGKNILLDGKVTFNVLKGTGSSAGNDHAVDAISGGTITSRGVEAMIQKCLGDYAAYIAKERAVLETASATEMTTDSVAVQAVDSTNVNN